MPTSDDVSPVLFLPAHPDADGDVGARVVFEPTRRADGASVIAAYTSPAALAAALGEQQPWVALDPSAAAALLGAAGVDQVVVDPPGRPAAARWDEARWADVRRFHRSGR